MGDRLIIMHFIKALSSRLWQLDMPLMLLSFILSNIRILGSVKVPLREVVHSGRQSASQTLTGKHREKLTVS